MAKKQKQTAKTGLGGKDAFAAVKPALKSKEALLLAGALLAILAAALLLPQIMQPFHAIARLLTEGNSTAKSIAFAGFVALCLAARAFSEPGERRWKAFFLAVVAAAMVWGAVLQLFFIGFFGANVNSFISHVTECGENWCWEGDYFQHNHVTKTALYFLEKNTGFSLGANVDTGRPMYEIFPWADFAAPITLILTALVAMLGLAAARREKDALNALLLAAAAGLFAIAAIDGGLFTQTGINAAALLAIYLWREKKASAEEKLIFPIAASAFVAFLPNLLMGSTLYYRDWFPGIAFLSAAFALLDAEKGWKRITMLGIMLFAGLYFAAHAYDKAYGESIAIYRTTTYIEDLPGAPNLVIYGLPPDASAKEVEALLPEITFSSSAKYGWYFVGSPSGKEPVKITTRQAEDRLRRAYPGGYLYAGQNRDAHQYRQAYVVWKKRPETTPDWALFSMKVLKIEEKENYTVLTGIAASSGNGLGLEIGSYAKSLNADAIVITGIT